MNTYNIKNYCIGKKLKTITRNGILNGKDYTYIDINETKIKSYISYRQRWEYKNQTDVNINFTPTIFVNSST